MANINLFNHARLDSGRVQQTVIKLCRDLQLRKRVRFVFEESWTDLIEETGEIVAGTESMETIWNGDAGKIRGTGQVRVRIPSRVTFPMVWNVRGELSGQYFGRVSYFNNPMEMFLYHAAHELRHLWQLEHSGKRERIDRLGEVDKETDKDLYALGVLSRYRQNPADRCFARRTAGAEEGLGKSRK